jgi:hypothetical protein
MIRASHIITTAVFALALAACGGGGGMSNGSMQSNGTSIATMGTITAFGSVVVNGVHYDVSNASITHNGVAVTQADLKVGQIARVHGMKNANGTTGQADHCDVDDRLVGPITSIDTTAGTLVALGQTVTVDSNTSFSSNITPASLAGLAANDVVEVSGLAAADGSIAATRIELVGATVPYQVIGKATGVDTTAHTFKINALIVDYSTAMVNGFTNGAPAEGDSVEVKGTTFDANSMTLTATRVTPEPDEMGDMNHGDHVEREGFITRFASATDFDVAGKPVTTTTTTVFKNGTASDLALNVHVEAEGALDANGVLVADTIVIHKDGIAELRGNVTAIDTTNGTVSLLGVTVHVTSDTRLEDRSSMHVEMFNLASLSVGDTVDIRGLEDPAGSGNIVATRLEREPASTTVVVGGLFTATTAPQFTILGITVDTTNAQFLAPEHGTLTSDQFFAQAPGHVVFVAGTFDGTTVAAAKVKLVSQPDCEDQF